MTDTELAPFLGLTAVAPDEAEIRVHIEPFETNGVSGEANTRIENDNR